MKLRKKIDLKNLSKKKKIAIKKIHITFERKITHGGWNWKKKQPKK